MVLTWLSLRHAFRVLSTSSTYPVGLDWCVSSVTSNYLLANFRWLRQVCRKPPLPPDVSSFYLLTTPSSYLPVLHSYLPRFRIGHTRLTYGHLMARETPPVCGRWQVRVLVECPAYSEPRTRFFPSLTLAPLHERLSFLLSEYLNFSSSTLFSFLSVSGLMSDL